MKKLAGSVRALEDALGVNCKPDSCGDDYYSSFLSCISLAA